MFVAIITSMSLFIVFTHIIVLKRSGSGCETWKLTKNSMALSIFFGSFYLLQQGLYLHEEFQALPI